MAKRSEFVEHIIALLGAARPARARAMFGGWGIYRSTMDGDRMVGLVADDTLYLKADADNAAEFDALGLEPFTFHGKQGTKPIAMSYRRAPEEAIEDAELLGQWFDIGLAAAIRSGAKPKQRA